MNAYNREQVDALDMVRGHLARITAAEKARLMTDSEDYLRFRRSLDAFLATYFGTVCSRACYRSRLSACCSREGIVTFFADVAINALVSPPLSLERLAEALQRGNSGPKCVYLGPGGCLWHVKPIVCAMFLCDRAESAVFQNRPELRHQWDAYRRRKKRFTWPDRPVLFDAIEARFMKAGYRSSLMYLHNSPGLIRVKKEAQKKK
jgi:hypothetical protein